MKDDLTPATKRGLRELETALKRDFQTQFQEFEKRIRRHFEVVIENDRHELLGANRDDIEVMKDRQRNHEQRIATLERSAGLVTH